MSEKNEGEIVSCGVRTRRKRRDQKGTLFVRLETSTTSSTLSARGIRGHGSDVFNATDLHAGARQSTQRRLSARAGSARANATRGTQTDVEGVDAYNAEYSR